MISYTSIILFIFLIKYCQPWRSFPIGHLKISKMIWSTVIKKGDIVIDSTAGKGNDSLFLAELALEEKGDGKLYCFDICKEAIDATKQKFLNNEKFSSKLGSQIILIQQSHENFPSFIENNSVSLICYNLGYFPERSFINKSLENKSLMIKTSAETTKKSILNSLLLLKKGGLLCVTTYVGHHGGKEEDKAVSNLFSNLGKTWKTYKYHAMDSILSPNLYLAMKLN